MRLDALIADERSAWWALRALWFNAPIIIPVGALFGGEALLHMCAPDLYELYVVK